MVMVMLMMKNNIYSDDNVNGDGADVSGGGSGMMIVMIVMAYVFPLILSQAIVFVVGGGNYIEYQNLMDYAKVRAALFYS